MRRIYCLLPDVQTARDAVRELKEADVKEGHIHLIAHPQTDLEGLPRASFMQKSETIPAHIRGAIWGGGVGALIGLGLMFRPEWVPGIGPLGIVLILVVAGILIGSWAAGMIGMDVAHPKVKEFEQDFNEGRVLMLLDVESKREEDLKDMIRRHHPEAEFKYTDAKAPLVP